ncbi:MAG: serine hydrolase [Natronohydrobacter sp.]|nr:serine hydrolase [Natronohydrobacter sp.]
MFCAVALAGTAQAAPYAAFVMDARNGEVIFARNHDTKLHPASLTKMMTLYVAFEAIKHGEVTLDTQFTVSRRATGTPCVCLGLRPGQRISLRYLLRAAALRSANDASVVIAEGISGSVEAFAERMTRTARAMGMSNTTFRNPHGLTQAGHLSTARDMSILGRQLYFDYPQYYNMFSRRSDDAGVAHVPNTNRRFLDAYQGADGIKTGFTNAAGFNLTASAKRGGKHIIATMFGGTSAAARNSHVAELMDIGFSRAPNRVATRAPRTPGYQGRGAVAVAAAPAPSSSNVNANASHAETGGAAKTIRLQMAVRKSPRPAPRPVRAPAEELLLAVRESVDTTVAALAVSEPEAPQAPEVLPVTPPPRETAALPTPEPTAEQQLDLAMAAGFSVVAPEELAAIAEPDEAATETTAEAAVETVAEAIAEALAETDATPATEPAFEPATELARVTPMPRPDTLTPPPGALAESPAAPETVIAQASPEAPKVSDTETTLALAQATDAATSDATAADEEMTWIGSAETILGEPQPGETHIDLATPLEDGPDPENTTELAQVLPASLSVPAEKPAAPAANPGIILTSKDLATPDSAERQAIAAVVEAHVDSAGRVISLSTSDGGRLWGVSLGQFNSRAAAERSLITVKMAEAASLGNGVSRIRQTSGRFEASFAGLTQSEAERACLRLSARAMDCAVAHP